MESRPSAAESPDEATILPVGSQLLVFSRTCGYRHDSIPSGVDALRAIASSLDLALDHTEDPAVFTPDRLQSYAASIWLSPSGEVLNDPQRRAFAEWVSDGHGFAGIHGATTCEYGASEYGKMVGARFVQHPAIQPATMTVEDRDHPSTRHLGKTWPRVDEWYNFETNPRPDVHVLACVDESTYEGGTMGADHPIAWSGHYGAGRTWYTALGHASETYSDETFVAHLRGGIASVLPVT